MCVVGGYLTTFFICGLLARIGVTLNYRLGLLLLVRPRLLVHSRCSFVMLRVERWQVRRTNFIPRFRLEGSGLGGMRSVRNSPSRSFLPHGGPSRLVCRSDRASYGPFNDSVPWWHSRNNNSSLPPLPPPPSPLLLLLLVLLLLLDPACVPKSKGCLFSQVVELRDVMEQINRQGGV